MNWGAVTCAGIAAVIGTTVPIITRRWHSL
jgi:hypothetical protein